MAQPVYRSPGSPVKFQSLAPGLKVFNQSMQQAMQGVSDLGAQQEKRDLEVNTRNMIAHRAQQRQEGGLGTGDLDLAGTEAHFGGAIDMAKVQAADAAGLSKQLSTASGTARLSATDAFNSGKTMAEAGEIFRQSMLEQGAQSKQAQTGMMDFRANNAFRTKDREIDQSRRFETGKTGIISDLTQAPDMSHDNAIQKALIGVPDYLREKYTTDYKEFLETRSALGVEDRENFDFQVSLQQNEAAAFDLTEKNRLSNMQSQLTSDPLAEASVAQVDKVMSGLRGPDVDISGTIEKGILHGVIDGLANTIAFNWDDETGTKAAASLKREMNDLVVNAKVHGLTHREAMALGYEAYRSSDQQSSIGTYGFDKLNFDERKEQLLAQMQSNKQATAEYNAAQNDYVTRRRSMTDRHAREAKTYKGALRKQNIRGGDVDITSIFKQALGGGGTVPGGASDTEETGTPKPLSVNDRIAAAIQALAKKVPLAVSHTPGAGLDVKAPVTRPTVASLRQRPEGQPRVDPYTGPSKIEPIMEGGVPQAIGSVFGASNIMATADTAARGLKALTAGAKEVFVEPWFNLGNALSSVQDKRNFKTNVNKLLRKSTDPAGDLQALLTEDISPAEANIIKELIIKNSK